MRSIEQDFRPITVTMQTAAKLSGPPRTSLYTLINNGRLQTTKVGRRQLVHYDSLSLLLKGKSAVAA